LSAGATVGGRAVVLLLATSVAWGLFWPPTKFIFSEVPIFSFRALCGVAGGAGMLAIGWAAGQSLRVGRGEWLPVALLGLLNTAGWLYFSALAIVALGSGRAVLIAYTMPLWTFLLSLAFLGERPSGRRWLGLVLGLAGVLVLVAEDTQRLLANPLGAAASLLAAWSWAAGAVWLKARRWQAAEMALVGWQQLLGGLPLAAIALASELPLLRATSFAVGAAILFNLAAGVVFGSWAWFRVVRMLPVTVASLGVLLVPVIGLLSSAVIVAEPLGPYALSALALIVLGVGAVLPLRWPPAWRKLARP